MIDVKGELASVSPILPLPRGQGIAEAEQANMGSSLCVWIIPQEL